MNRGRPARERARIEAAAEMMLVNGARINKSRIAREQHVSLRHVFRVLPRISI